jgi:hypothetical protein
MAWMMMVLLFVVTLRRQLGEPEEGHLLDSVRLHHAASRHTKPMILIDGKREKRSMTLIDIALLFLLAYLHNPINVDDVCRMFKD